MDDERWVLISRVQSLIHELDWAKSSLDKIDPKFGRLIFGRLAEPFKVQDERLRNLKEGVLNAKSSRELTQWWDSYNRQKEACEALFEECLALIQGSVVREDGDLCDIADALLNDLSDRTGITWGRFTILAIGESFGKVPEVIRIRFPEASIWNLPVAVHEFGHFLTPRLEKESPDGRSYRPLQELLDRKSGRERSYLREQIGDLFATYALGPAYACACLLLRFDPRMANVDGEEHPSPAKRVYGILRVLEKLDEAAGRSLVPPYRGLIDHLRKSWGRSLAQVGQAESLKEEEIRALDQGLDVLYKRVDEQLFAVRYNVTDWNRAKEISKQLLQKEPLVIKDDYRLADVLNAAWWGRVNQEKGENSLIQQVGMRALELCKKLI